MAAVHRFGNADAALGYANPSTHAPLTGGKRRAAPSWNL